MDDKKWAKWAALGGVVFVVLNVVGTILMGAMPMPDDTNDEVYEWFVDKESSIRTAVLMGAVSIIFLAWWFGSLWRRMSQAEANQNRLSILSLVGFTGSGVLYGASSAVQSSLAIFVDEIDPVGTRFFWLLSTVLISMSGAFIVTHLLATNVLALRSGFLPKWNAWIGFVPAASFLVAMVGVHSDTSAAMIGGGVGFVTWSIWILATSFHMWKTAD